jgi:hypothetical protein
MEERLNAIEAENKALSARVEALEIRLGLRVPPARPPTQPFNPIDLLAVPRHVIDDMVKAVPDFRSIAEEQRRR